MYVLKLIQKVYKKPSMNIKIKFLIIFFILIYQTNSFSSELKKIIIEGNERISPDTIRMFSNIEVGQKITNIDLYTKLMKSNNENEKCNCCPVNKLDQEININKKKIKKKKIKKKLNKK